MRNVFCVFRLRADLAEIEAFLVEVPVATGILSDAGSSN